VKKEKQLNFFWGNGFQASIFYLSATINYSNTDFLCDMNMNNFNIIALVMKIFSILFTSTLCFEGQALEWKPSATGHVHKVTEFQMRCFPFVTIANML
jgi:hypothetical protein